MTELEYCKEREERVKKDLEVRTNTGGGEWDHLWRTMTELEYC